MLDSAQRLFDAALARMPTALRPVAQSHWRNFCEHLARLPHAHAERWLEILPRAFAASDFVARTCAQHIEVLRDLIDTGDLLRAYAPGELGRRVAHELTGVADVAALKTRLRLLRRREMLRIALRDLGGWAELPEVLAGLSEFADACLEGALAHIELWAAARHGTPRGEGGRPAQFVVLALGKLGGRELNFSSDIDLIFAYTEDGWTEHRRPLSNHEFFNELGRALIQVLSDASEDGFVFRVDMRLRPNGASGPLAMSFDALENYYQTHGRVWERYAFVKARVVAGAHADGEQLLARLKPFVYRRYLDFGAVEEIRGLKIEIDRELRRKGLAQNIKLGPGGIREIEFIAQALQLIRGGREPQLQERSLQKTLALLADARHLTAQAADELHAAYVFLRNTEHRLQMAADRQTHVLPDDALEQLRLAFGVGFDTWDAFHAELRRHGAKVQAQFERMFRAPQREAGADDANDLAGVWQDGVESDGARAALSAAGYRDSDTVFGLLRALRAGSAYAALSTQGRERIDRLMPLLLAAASFSADPDTTLARLITLIEAIGRRAAYLALLVENPMALSQLVKLCAASAWISAWLSRHPVLLDELLDPASLYAPLSRPALQAELHRRLASLPPDDLEAQMELLREFRHSHLLRIAAADVGPGLTSAQVSGYLSDLAETLLEAALPLARRALTAKHGAPQAPEFCVIGYGRLGSRELSYGSDLDMIFVHRAAAAGQTAGPQPIPDELFFARLGQRLIHILTARTPAGTLYAVDMRLRPSGQSGTLVTPLAAFRDYQLQHAWTWEHQALVRARAVAGSPALAEAFAAVRAEVLCRPRDPQKLRAEVAAMRARMTAERTPPAAGLFDLKHGRGGMIDIEFMVQYCTLRWAHAHPVLASKTDNLSLLEALGQAGLLEQGRTRLLTDAYRRYLSAEQRLKLMEREALVPAVEMADTPQRVAAVWHELFNEESM